MVTSMFSGWLNSSFYEAAKVNGLTIKGEFHTWEEVYRKSLDLTDKIPPNSTVVIDPCGGFNSMAALMYVCSVRDVNFIWSPISNVSFDSVVLSSDLYQVVINPIKGYSHRSFYGTYTSGSSGDARLPLGYVDQMALVGSNYDLNLYEPSLGNVRDGGILAVPLPLEYSATFMMAILPACFTARNLVIVEPDRWDVTLDLASKNRVCVLTVPALLPALCVSANKKNSEASLDLITTAGYLTRNRILAVQDRLRKASFMTSYGASETGVMTIDRNPDGKLHVGKPIFGKPVWISSVTDDGVGKVTTSGPDCREFYLDGEQIKSQDGIVSSTDLGHFDETGNLYLDGRLDSGQKYRGVLVYPRRIERHILACQNVVDAKVKIVNGQGVSPDVLAATVVGEITDEEIRDHCNSLPDSIRPNKFIIKSEREAYSSRGKM